VGLITPHRTYLTITKTHKGRPRPDPGCSATDDDDDLFIYLSPTERSSPMRLKQYNKNAYSTKRNKKIITYLSVQYI
jgi:hypothetical protein